MIYVKVLYKGDAERLFSADEVYKPEGHSRSRDFELYSNGSPHHLSGADYLRVWLMTETGSTFSAWYGCKPDPEVPPPTA